MLHIQEFDRNITKQAAGYYLNDQETGDLFDAYMKLKEASGNGYGNELASNYVDVPMSMEYETIDNILDMIDSTKFIISTNHAENPIFHIDWIALQSQKDTLKQIQHFINTEQAEDIEGLLNLIDSIEDYAIDILGFDENEVLNIDEEELIGYQAMDDNGFFHPNTMNTYSVYSKSQIKEMIGDDNQWKIVPIYKGTIENPEYMFEGYPEN